LATDVGSLVLHCSAALGLGVLAGLRERATCSVEIPRCTESRVAPGADATLASVFFLAAMLGAAAAISDSDCEQDRGFMRCFGRDVGTGVAGGAGLLSIGFGGSAWYGFARTRDCRNARQRALPAGEPGSSLPLPPLRLIAEREPGRPGT
jgi:hypothetical protein